MKKFLSRKYNVLITFVLILFTTLAFDISAFANSDKYVSPNGNDSNNGTLSAPYKTIARAIAKSNPGDTILVRGGTYQEAIRISKFGVGQQKWLTIKPYNNEKVILDGAKSDPKSSVRGIIIENSHYIKIDNLIIQNFTSTNADASRAGILVRDGSTNIELTNNEIYKIENHAPKGSARGIYIFGNTLTPTKNILIKNNYLHDLVLGRSETITVSGNVTDFQILNNRLVNNTNIGIDVAGHFGACSLAGCEDIARNGIVAYNYVEGMDSYNSPAYPSGGGSSGGIYVDGGKNITIAKNIVTKSNFGIEVASENKGKLAENITVFNNHLSENHKAGIVLGGSSTSNGGTKNVRVMDNIFMLNNAKSTGYTDVSFQHNNQDVFFDDNSYFTCYSSDVYSYLRNADKKSITLDKNIGVTQIQSSCSK